MCWKMKDIIVILPPTFSIHPLSSFQPRKIIFALFIPPIFHPKDKEGHSFSLLSFPTFPLNSPIQSMIVLKWPKPFLPLYSITCLFMLVQQSFLLLFWLVSYNSPINIIRLVTSFFDALISHQGLIKSSRLLGRESTNMHPLPIWYYVFSCEDIMSSVVRIFLMLFNR